MRPWRENIPDRTAVKMNPAFEEGKRAEGSKKTAQTHTVESDLRSPWLGSAARKRDSFVEYVTLIGSS
jgi:hypothetical protein